MGLLGDIGGAVGGIFGGLPGAFLGSGGVGNGGIAGAAQDIATGGAYSNTQAAMNINDQNIAFAQKQMDFQQQNSNTAYQRAVADMRAAGLNPMLAYSQGGASVPQGTTPQLTNPEPGNIAAGLINSAKSIASGVPELNQKLASTENTKKDTELTTEKVSTQQAQTNQTEQQTQNTYADTTNKMAQHAVILHQARKAKAEAKSAEMDTAVQANRFGFDKGAAKYDAAAERVGPVLKGVGETILGKGILQKLGGALGTNAKSPYPYGPGPKYQPKTFDWKKP